MLRRLSRQVVRHRGLTLGLTCAFLAVSAAIILLVGGRLSSGIFHGIESEEAREVATRITGHPGESTVVAIFAPRTESQTGEDVSAALERAVEPLRHHPRVANVVTPQGAPTFLAARLIDEPSRMRLALITLAGDRADVRDAYAAAREQLRSEEVDITCTGVGPFMHDLDQTLERDLRRAELIALPLAFLVLVLVFRSIVAALLPVCVGALSVIGGIGVVLGLSHFADVALYSINVCSLIGLGVSIDYSLFFVSRYREERARGAAVDDAIEQAMATAGRTVLFSGAAVCVGLLGLLFFSGTYIFWMGLSGVLVVVLAVVVSLTLLPAIVSLLGDNLERGRVRLPWAASVSEERWGRLARLVMRRPVVVGLPIVALLLAMAVPFFHLRVAAADVGVLDREAESRRGFELLKEHFPAQAKSRILVAVEFPTSPALTPARIEALYELTERARGLPAVSGVESLFSGSETVGPDELELMLLHPSGDMAPLVEQGKALTVGASSVILYALTDAPTASPEARSIVRALRSSREVADGRLVVGGDIARDIDAGELVAARSPWAIAFVIVATLLLVFLLLRSVVLPVEAVVMNLLSMAGAFGALVWIFQDGNLGIAEPRPLEPSLPILLFCVLFGLSMDYQVLLLSRIAEAHRGGRSNEEAIAEGLAKTAGVFTSAAAIMICVFVAFAFADVVLIRAVGVGMAVAIFLDATLVRTLLTPALMRLAGEANWWRLPGLRRDERPGPPRAEPGQPIGVHPDGQHHDDPVVGKA